MFSRTLSIASIALVAASSVAALAVPFPGHVVRRSHHNIALARDLSVPEGWATGYLEDYDTYHFRYIALDCEDQHNTTFFDQCCHPLLATEQLSSRPPQCTPSAAASSSAAAAEPTSTVTTPVDTEPSPSSSPPAPSPTQNTFAPSPSPEAPAPSPSPSPSSSSSNSGLITGGFATWFTQNGVAGACGTVHSDQDLIAAIDQDRYGSSGGASSLCGQQVQITNNDNGNVVVVTIADDCPTCNNENSIDLSEAAFQVLAPLSVGQLNISWKFL